jgi:hypothetical protein
LSGHETLGPAGGALKKMNVEHRTFSIESSKHRRTRVEWSKMKKAAYELKRNIAKREAPHGGMQARAVRVYTDDV